jgi:hypothetical protein
MSNFSMETVWNESQHGGTALLVMLALADNSVEGFYSWPDLEMVARRVRCTHDQLLQILNDLVASGELRTVDVAECRRKFRYSPKGRPCYQIMLGVTANVLDWRRPEAVYIKLAISPRLRSAILERDGRNCRNCGATEDLTIDHIVPERLGGTQDPTNLQVLCRSCNSRKGARAI